MALIGDRDFFNRLGGVPCWYCDEMDCWASHRVTWTDAEGWHSRDVGARCAYQMIGWIENTAVRLTPPVEVELMGAADYRRHHIELPTEWDTITIPSGLAPGEWGGPSPLE